MRFRRLFASLALLPLLAACAAPASPELMIAAEIPSDVQKLVESSPLRFNLAINSVSGGQETNPMWGTSQVGNVEFQTALSQSLTKAKLLKTDGEARYKLDASLLSLAQPFAGFDMTVTSTVMYRVTDTSTSSVVYEENIVRGHTATFGDSALGVARLKIANEGSIRANIENAISDMVRKITSNPAPAAPTTQSAPVVPTS